MATLNDVIDGLSIFKKYDPEHGESHWPGAADEMIFVDMRGKVGVSSEDEEKLRELGWFLGEVDRYEGVWQRYV